MTRARRSAEAALERRYRRLLAWYPPGYLSANGEEMLGVAMAGAAPDQRRPDWREAVNLVLSGTRARFGRLLSGARRPAWGGAGAVVALLGSAVLAATHLWLFTRTWPGGLGFAETSVRVYQLVLVPDPSAVAIAFVAGWAVVAVVSALRWRRLAAVGASLGAVGEAVHLAVRQGSDAAFVAGSWWQLLLATVTALAAITALAGAKSGTRPLSWRTIGAVWIASGVFGAAPLIQKAISTRTAVFVSAPPAGVQFLLNDGVILLLTVTLLAVVLRVEMAARRRVFVMFTAPAVAAALSAVVSQVSLIWQQWAALLCVPVLGLAMGLIWLRRHERTLQVAAGQNSAGTPGDPPQSHR